MLKKLLKKPLFQKRRWSLRFPAKKNAGCPKAPCDFPPRKDGILCPRRVVLGLPSPSHRVCGRTDVWMYGRTDGQSRDYYVTTKISRIDRLPYFLNNGARLAGFARRLHYKDGLNSFLIMFCTSYF